LIGGAARGHAWLRGCAVAVLVAGFLLPAAYAATPGAIVGVVRNAASAPVAGATVTALRAGGEAIRATVSGSDGVFSFADLPPGNWSLTLEASGYVQAQVATLEVIASKATRRDVVLSETSGAAPPATAAAAPPVSPALTAAIVAAVAQAVPEALQAPDPAPANDTVTPFANDDDIGWMNGNTREKAPLFDTRFFTPEVRFDVNYLNSFNNPHDHTIVGSTEEFRSGEFQIEQVSLGGNFHWHGVQARFLSMFGMFATTTPRNDASAGVGNWDLQGAYKYFSEANAGYHWDKVGHGLNVDAGIFVSYIGLFSYYNFDNWTYQPSFVSSNTPWFFNGLRIQYWPTQDLKIEPWLINGWQSYARYNHNLGFGGQILWIPSNNFKLVLNSYFLGEDNLNSGSGQPNNGGNPNASIGLPNPNAPFITYAHVHRIHEDDSLLWRYYQAPDPKSGDGISKMAISLTWDIGCEYGGGVDCWRGTNKANFFGVMAYDRTWFAHDQYAVTFGGGFMNNPGRYLALLPPINAATASSGTAYFSENPGQKLYQWDVQLNLQYMPKDWITWWTEATFRHSDVPYWSGPGGVTPPLGNTGAPASFVCNNGSTIGADNCANEGGVWFPDLRTREIVWGAGVMVKF
jgi:hypothetical protein